MIPHEQHEQVFRPCYCDTQRRAIPQDVGNFEAVEIKCICDLIICKIRESQIILGSMNLASFWTSFATAKNYSIATLVIGFLFVEPAIGPLAHSYPTESSSYILTPV